MTRIRYKKDGINLFSQELAYEKGLCMVVINNEFKAITILDCKDNTVLYNVPIKTSLQYVKKHVKETLQKLGVVLDSEVRSKRRWDI
jgi:hypothetical protein